MQPAAARVSLPAGVRRAWTRLSSASRISPGGHEYPVALLRWTAAGEELRANATLPESLQPGGFANPFTLDEILAAYAGAAGAEPLLARAGQQLYACLVQGDVATRLRGLDAVHPAGYRRATGQCRTSAPSGGGW